MMEMIPFFLYFQISLASGGRGGGLRPLQTPFSTYILSETRNYVYIIFCANTIISSATRHHSNISLASTNNIRGILKADI